MEEQNFTSAEAAETAAISGETLFEQYEGGASVDALNELLATQEEEQREEEQESEASDDATQEQTVSEETVTEENPGETTQEKQTKPPRMFTQRDVDYMIGKKTSELANKHSTLLDDLSALLGISRDEVTNAVRKQRYESEAEAAGVADKDLYARTKQLEQQNEQIKKQMKEQQEKKQFDADIDHQIVELQKKTPEFDMNRCVENRQFSGLVLDLYQNAATREQALELAYRAVYFDDALRQAVSAEREKIITSVRSGQMRVQEGAANGGGGAAARPDVSRMTDEQIADMAQRAANGEQITL